MGSKAKSLYNLLTESYGVGTTLVKNPITGTCGTSVTRLLMANPMRLSLLIMNLGANTVFIAPHGAPSSSNGIYLAPNGGAVAFTWDEDFELTASEFFGVAISASSAMYILEVLSTPISDTR